MTRHWNTFLPPNITLNEFINEYLPLMTEEMLKESKSKPIKESIAASREFIAKQRVEKEKQRLTNEGINYQGKKLDEPTSNKEMYNKSSTDEKEEEKATEKEYWERREKEEIRSMMNPEERQEEEIEMKEYQEIGKALKEMDEQSKAEEDKNPPYVIPTNMTLEEFTENYMPTIPKK